MKIIVTLILAAFIASCNKSKPVQANDSAPVVVEEVKPEPEEPILDTITWMMDRPVCQSKRTREYSALRRSSLAVSIERQFIAQGGTRKEQEAFIWLICKESQFDHMAKSPVGAMGLTQMMPPTAQETSERLALGKVGSEDLYDPEISLRLGYNHFLHLSKMLNGNLAKVSASYNGGMAGATMKALKTGGLGAHETDNYVASLYNTMEELRIHKEGKAN